MGSFFHQRGENLRKVLFIYFKYIGCSRFFSAEKAFLVHYYTWTPKALCDRQLL